MRNYFAIFRKIIIFASWYSAICWICSHTLRGCVDWNDMMTTGESLADVTPFVGVWIETPELCHTCKAKICHTLRGCVDWNTKEILASMPKDVTPFVGVWIETGREGRNRLSVPVTPFVGVWIETFEGKTVGQQCSHTLRGCVDWNIDKYKTQPWKL